MNYFTVGKIVNTHGLKGEVKIQLITDSPNQRFKKNQQLFLDRKKLIPITVSASRAHKNLLIVKFNEFNDINEIEQYKNVNILIEENQREQLGESEYFFDQIIGLTAIDEKKREIGQVKEILRYPANDVLVITHSQKEILVPMVGDIVKEIDLENRTIVVENREGLFLDEN